MPGSRYLVQQVGDGSLVRRVTSPKGQWSEGLGLGLGLELGLVLGAECLRKFNETPKSRKSTLFMHGVPVLPFRHGTGLRLQQQPSGQ